MWRTLAGRPDTGGATDPRLPLTPVTIAPNDFTHLHVHSEFSLLDGLGRITELVDAAAQHGMDSMALTDHGALYGAVAFYQAAKDQGDQADHRRRDLRRPPVDDRQGGQGRRPAVPPGPAGPGLDRLPEPVPPDHRRAHRRLLLQAPHRPRAPRPPQRRPDRPVGLPDRRDPAGAGDRGLGARAQAGRGVRATSSARTASSSSCRTTACPSSGGSTSSCCAWRRRRASRWSSTNDLHYVRPRPVGGARRPALRGDRQQPRHAQPDALRDARVLREVGRPDGRALPGPARGDPEHAADRRDDRHRAAARPAPDPAFPGARGPHHGELAARRVPARARASLRDGHAGAPDPARLRARRDPVDGLRGVLPDRRRLHPVRPRAADPDHLPRLGAGLDRDLHARDHAGRPDPLPAAVRALPQPGPGDDAGHRRRLRGRAT